MIQNDAAESGVKDSVRDRLLDAAEILFCEKGYDNVSVRDLTGQANCNVAAVNYYFGGKDKLYHEMFRRHLKQISEMLFDKIDEVMSRPNPTLEALIRETIAPPMQAIYEKQLRGQVLRLMAMEVLNHSCHSDSILGDFHYRVMDRTVQSLMQLFPEMDPKTAKLIFTSLDSLKLHPILFMDRFLEVIEGLTFEDLLEHIIRFSCLAIRGIVTAQQQK